SGPSLGAPADADSILSVGIVDTKGVRCGYSSTGPAFDKRIKPEVVSQGPVEGCAVSGADGYVDTAYDGAGTSFDTPAVAGVAVLVRQAHPELNAMAVRDRLL